MAGPDRRQAPDLKLALLRRGHEFAFYQALRLLRIVSGARGESGAPAADPDVRIRPELSFGFPPADVARIEETPEGPAGHRMTVTFMGLYGVSSPLPAFYTEELIDDAHAESCAARDFLDILHQRLYLLLFRCWAKYRLFVRVAEEGDPAELEKLFCFVGLGERPLRAAVPGAHGLLRYAGLFTQFPRSAAGLRGLLRDALGGVPVEVVPCVPRKASIPEDQRARLGEGGVTLGADCYLGSELDDRMGKFRLQIGPLEADRFDALLPGRADHARVAFLVGLYLTDPLEYDLELVLAAGEARTARPGAPRWSSLGLDTWIFSGERVGEVAVAFPPQPLSEVA